MKLILASEFDISFHKTKEIIKREVQGKAALFIPTAAYGEGDVPDPKTYKKPFEDMGMSVNEFDLKDKSNKEVELALTDVSLICVCGGNTFYLLEQMNKCGFKNVLIDKLAAGTVYVGSSAGSIVMSPDIGFISEMDSAEKADLPNYKALNLVDFLFLPHCDHPEMGNDANKIIQNHNIDSYPLYAMNDDQAMYVENNIIRIL